MSKINLQFTGLLGGGGASFPANKLGEVGEREDSGEPSAGGEARAKFPSGLLICVVSI